MPALKKPVGTRQDNRPQRGGNVVALPSRDEIPVPPQRDEDDEQFLPESKRLWEKFWASPPAGVAIDVDVVVAERWIEAHDEWRRAMKVVRRNRTVDGSTGQPTMNPLAAWAKSQADEMRKCEASLGIGPKERIALGIDIGKGKLTAAQLNKMTQQGPPSDNNTGSAADNEILDDFA